MTQPSPTPPTPTPATAKRRGMVLLAAFLGWMFDGLEMGIFPLIARPALQQMQANHGIVDDKFVGHWMGWVTAAFLLGAAGGGLLFGWLGDKVGRVRAMSLAILCYSIFTGLVYFAAEPWHLAALRFVAALGMGGEWALGVALSWKSGRKRTARCSPASSAPPPTSALPSSRPWACSMPSPRKLGAMSW